MCGGKSLFSLCDFNRCDLVKLLDLADRMADAIGFDDRRQRQPVTPLDSIMASLFYEPSTRTRFSFEAAMLRLGGQVLGFAEPGSSSVAKGETLADTVRTVGGYADIIVIRHPLAGAARVAARYAGVPVINAGDGPREHPTQTLTDLFCIRRELGTLEGLKVGLCGDLKYGRTVHSLAPVLAGWGCEIIGIAPAELGMPDEFVGKIHEAGGTYTPSDSLEAAIAEVDVLYMTRIQRERFPSVEEYEKVKGVYVLTPELMESAKEGMRVLHPLPRVDEIAPALDVDRRAAYFRQAAGGVPVRMALVTLLLGLPCGTERASAAGFGKAPQPHAAHSPVKEQPVVPGPGPCPNPGCITAAETYLAPEYREIEHGLVCAYCDKQLPA